VHRSSRESPTKQKRELIKGKSWRQAQERCLHSRKLIRKSLGCIFSTKMNRYQLFKHCLAPLQRGKILWNLISYSYFMTRTVFILFFKNVREYSITLQISYLSKIRAILIKFNGYKSVTWDIIKLIFNYKSICAKFLN